MNRKHAAVIAALLGAAIAAGAFAATRTSAAAEPGRGGAPEQAIVGRSRSLDEIERSLEQTLTAAPSQAAPSGAPAYRGDDSDESVSRDDRASGSYDSYDPWGSASDDDRAGSYQESDDGRGYGDDGYESERGDD